MAKPVQSIRMTGIRFHFGTRMAICFLCSAPLAGAADVNMLKLQRAAEKGEISKQVELARDYLVGLGLAQDVQMAAFWYKKAAESGDAEAENHLGLLYQTGQGVPVDNGRALHWFQLAAASGLPMAKANLAEVYILGIGVQKDEILAAQLFREAAAKRCGVAATYLGDMYFLGFGVQQNKAAGEAWYEKGVKLHDPFSEYDLGLLLSTSKDHPHDLSRAAKLLRQSAAVGYVPAMHTLALLLTNHPELADSRQEARPLFEVAASAGWWKSSIALGALARDQGGDAAGIESAFFHFQIAMLQGGEEAGRILSHDLSALEGELTASRRNELKSEARAWYSKHTTVFEFVFQDTGSGRKKWLAASSLASVSKAIHSGILLPVPSSNAGHIAPYVSGREIDTPAALPLGRLPIRATSRSTVKSRTPNASSFSLTAFSKPARQTENCMGLSGYRN
jgi:TPR repeat protein